VQRRGHPGLEGDGGAETVHQRDDREESTHQQLVHHTGDEQTSLQGQGDSLHESATVDDFPRSGGATTVGSFKVLGGSEVNVESVLKHDAKGADTDRAVVEAVSDRFKKPHQAFGPPLEQHACYGENQPQDKGCRHFYDEFKVINNFNMKAPGTSTVKAKFLTAPKPDLIEHARNISANKVTD
jgi:hypothetical protein